MMVKTNIYGARRDVKCFTYIITFNQYFLDGWMNRKREEWGGEGETALLVQYQTQQTCSSRTLFL